jgi:hypothetical protein
MSYKEGFWTKLRLKDDSGVFTLKDSIEIEVETRLNEKDKDPFWICVIRFSEDGIHHEIFLDGKLAGTRIQPYYTLEAVFDHDN